MTALSWTAVAQALDAQLAAFVSVLLLMSALHKGLARAQSLRAVRELGRMPQPLAPWALGLATALELIAAVALFAPHYRVQGAWLAGCLWLSYAGLMVNAIAQGRRDIDCGCSFGAARHALGRYHVIRNALLAAGCAAVAVGSAAQGAPPFEASDVLAAAALLALYAALDQVMALTAPRAGAVL